MPASAGAIASAASQAMGVGLGVYELIDSAHQEKKAKNELNKLKVPFYKIQDEYFQNKNLAAGNAQFGTPQTEKDFADKERERGLSTGIGALLSSGASPNDINTLLGTFNNSVDRSAAQSAQQKLQNIQYFMNVNKDLAGQKTIQWGFNEAQPYERALQDITRRRDAAAQNKMQALSLIAGSTSAAGTSMQNQGLTSGGGKAAVHDTLFPKGSVSTTNPTNDKMEEIFNQLYGINP